MILFFFRKSSAKSAGMFMGQIYAKGMHTSLLVTVIISEDNQFAFAGVNKGSMEMLVFDIGRLPHDMIDAAVSSEADTGSANKRPKGESVLENITLYRHMDPKLRGFGAVVCVRHSLQGSETPVTEYLLACGKGIKNVHIFSYFPHNSRSGTSPGGSTQPVLQCLYDVASNGNTIESLCFHGPSIGSTHYDYCSEAKKPLQLLSKSSGANIRIWDLTEYRSDTEGASKAIADSTESTTATAPSLPLTKCNYEDIPNSADIKYLFNQDYCYGGVYEFALLNTSAPRSACKQTVDLPSPDIGNLGSSTDDLAESSGGRKRR